MWCDSLKNRNKPPFIRRCRTRATILKTAVSSVSSVWQFRPFYPVSSSDYNSINRWWQSEIRRETQQTALLQLWWGTINGIDAMKRNNVRWARNPICLRKDCAHIFLRISNLSLQCTICAIHIYVIQCSNKQRIRLPVR